MSGLFQGLEIGKRALATNQVWLQTIGHNVANVDTPGFSRQKVAVTTTYPQETTIGLIGSGVKATRIYQIRDEFLTQQYRSENKDVGEWTAQEKTLTQIESILNEPNDDSLGSLLDQFWSSWSDLAKPENVSSASARLNLVSVTNVLTDGLHTVYSKLEDMRKSIDTDVKMVVDEVNLLTGSIASLNKQIVSAEHGGETANDLRDQRALLIDELSNYVDVNTNQQKNGATTVYIGAMAIVEGDKSYNIDTKSSKSGNLTTSTIVWEGTSQVIKNVAGELKGLLETRDETIPGYLESLDELAATLVREINSRHSTGYDLNNNTGINFFDPTRVSAGNISLNIDVENNVDMIAAKQSDDPDAVGDNSNALAIAALKDALLMTNNTTTVSEYYSALLGAIGVDSANATRLRENHTLLLHQIENQRQSIQGVSLDEEMTQIIKYQQAYDAAARVITTMDEALDTVINYMGV